MSSDEVEVFKINVPYFDIEINDPFTVKVEDIRISLTLLSIDVKASLPQLIPVDTPVINATELIQLINPDLIRYGKSSFDDVIAVIPTLATSLLLIEDNIKEKLINEVRKIQSRRVTVKTEASGLEINIPVYQINELPSEARDRYSVKIKITRRNITPEIKEFIEERLTKEFKITRIVKKMEVIDNETNLMELEFVMRDFLKKIKRYGFSRKAP